MQGKYAILALVVIGLAATGQAALKDIPPYNRESPNARLNDEVFADDDYRLPNNTEPVEYDIKLTTNIHNAELPFDGRVDITINVIEDTKTVVLHQRRLTINKATIRDITSQTERDMTWSYESTREFLSLTPSDTSITLLKDSTWVLSILYNGTLRTDNGGFYRSTYKDENENTR